MDHVLHTLAFGMGDPTWMHAFLLMAGIVVVAVAVAWFVTRKRG